MFSFTKIKHDLKCGVINWKLWRNYKNPNRLIRIIVEKLENFEWISFFLFLEDYYKFWNISAIEHLWDAFVFVGNDLARVLRWGPGYTGGEDPLNLLRDVIDAEEIRLDRWTVVFHPEDKSDDSVKQVNSTGKKRQKLSKMKVTNEQIKKGQSYVYVDVVLL